MTRDEARRVLARLHEAQAAFYARARLGRCMRC